MKKFKDVRVVQHNLSLFRLITQTDSDSATVTVSAGRTGEHNLGTVKIPRGPSNFHVAGPGTPAFVVHGQMNLESTGGLNVLWFEGYFLHDNVYKTAFDKDGLVVAIWSK